MLRTRVVDIAHDLRVTDIAHDLKLTPQQVKESLRLNLLGQYSQEPILRRQNFISIVESRTGPEDFASRERFDEYTNNPEYSPYMTNVLNISPQAIDALARELGIQPPK